MEYEALCAVYLRVKFTDDGKMVLRDQTHDALKSFIDVPWDRLDDAEIIEVHPVEAP